MPGLESLWPEGIIKPLSYPWHLEGEKPASDLRACSGARKDDTF